MKRSESSRINGAKSRGPVTPEGKARSSRNALTHGLTAQDICLSVEDQDQFNQLRSADVDKFQPQEAVETGLVNEMVAAKWRQQRLWKLETADLDFGIAEMKKKLAGVDPPPFVLAAFAANDENKPLDLYARYEARLSSIYNRALRNLRELRRLPIPVPPPAPEVVEDVVQNEPETAPNSTKVVPFPDAPVNSTAPATPPEDRAA